MLIPILTALGGTGALLLLLRYFWPGFFLDMFYKRQMNKVTAGTVKELAKGNFLIDVFEDKVKLHPKKTFIIFHDKKFSYEEIDRLANQAARAALEIGVKPGDVVSLMIHNEPAFVWTHLGFQKAGIQASLVNFNLRTRSLAHCIKSSGSRVLVVGEGEKLSHAVTEILPDIADIAVYQQGPVQDQKAHQFPSFTEVMARAADDTFDRAIRKPVVQLFKPYCFIFTSGTTGLPKPAIVTQVRALGAGHVFNNFDMSPDDIVYTSLPMYHSAGMMLGFGNVITKGATMVIREKFSASHFWEDCRKHDVTVIQYIGEICRYLLASPRHKLDGLHRLKCAVGNGLRQDIWVEFQSRFKIPRIIEFYGATECPIAFYNLSNRVGACGRSSPYQRTTHPAAVVKYDLESQGPVRNRDGRCIPVDFDEAGLLIIPLIQGKSSFQGYHNRKDATSRKILRDVFEEGDQCMNTGDLMRVDKDYFLYFNDRIGDTFRWKGENVSTTEVSNILTDVEFIHDANVYGVAIPGSEGRAGMASLTLNDDSLDSLSSQMLLTISRHVKETLPNYARPRFLRVQKEFALTSTFKQQKMTLVAEGFDVKKVPDPLYYLNPATHSYQPLDHVMYCQIIAGKIPI